MVIVLCEWAGGHDVVYNEFSNLSPDELKEMFYDVVVSGVGESGIHMNNSELPELYDDRPDYSVSLADFIHALKNFDASVV